MKRTIRGLCLLFFVILVVCALPTAASAATTKVTKLDIKMSEPALGKKPADKVTFNGSTKAEFVDIQWYGEFDSNGGFKANEVYSAKIDFKIQTKQKNSVFTAIEPKNMIVNGKKSANGQVGSEVSADKKSVSICYIFPYYFTESGAKKSIEYLNMTECTLEVPEVGKKPATVKQIRMNDGSSLEPENIKWTGKLDSKGRFVAGKKYTAKISLKLKSGDMIAVAAHPALLKSQLQINGNPCDKLEWSYSCDGIVLYYTFTARKAVKNITEVDNVKVSVTAPKVGAWPRYDAKVADGWKSYVTHSEWSGNFDKYGRFQTGEEYTFTVTTRVDPREGAFFYDYMGSHILNDKFITKRTVSNDGKEITISYTFPALTGKAAAAPKATKVTAFKAGDYGVMEMNDSRGGVSLYDGMGADKSLYKTQKKGAKLLVLSAFVQDNWCAVLYDGQLLYTQHSNIFSNYVKYGNASVEPYQKPWQTAEEVTGGKPISLVGGFIVTAKVNTKLTVKDDYKKDDAQYYMAEVTSNYEGKVEPYTWAEVVVTCKAKDGYYFTHDVKTDLKTFAGNIPDEVIYVDSKTVKLVYYRWVFGRSVDQGKTEAMKTYLEMHVVENANAYPHVGTAELYQPIEIDPKENESNYLYDYPSTYSSVNRTQLINTTAQIRILDWDLTDEIPEMTGEWCRIAFGTIVGFIPKACLTDVVLQDFWEGAPAQLHDSPFEFAGGYGTEKNPYLIATAEQLDAVRKDLDAHYKLIADIDLSKWGNWVPIGGTPAFGAGTNIFNKAQYGAGAFKGSFDGNGHVISGMTIKVKEVTPFMQEKSNDRFYGLFGITGGATIKNLGLVNYNIDVSYTGVTEDITIWAGAFSGWFNCPDHNKSYDAPGDMENCYADDGKISFNVNPAKNSKASISIEVGGLVGTASLGKIHRCYHGSDITVKCNSPFYLAGAGIAATITHLWITECYNTGSISFPVGDAQMHWKDSFVGGIVGEVTPNGIKNSMGKPKEQASYIANCYNAGHLTANTVAGIYVSNHSLAAGYIENCYNVGKLTSQTKTDDGQPELRKASIMTSFASCCNSTYMKKCYNNGNKVSGSAWQKSAKLGRMVLKALPEDVKGIPALEELRNNSKDEGKTTDGIDITKYSKAVQWAFEKKIITEDDLKNIDTEKKCTRAEFITYLWRAAGSPKATGNNPYSDVKEKHSYYDAALWAYKNGMSITSTAFIATVQVPRDEVMFCLWKYVGSPASTTKFSDILAKKKEAVGWAVDNKVAEPQSDVKFGGTTKCTHEEVLTYMYKAVVEAPKVEAEKPANDGIDLTKYSKEIQWAVEKKILTEVELKNFKADKNCTRGAVLTYLWRAAGSPKVSGENPFTDLRQNASYYEAAIWAYNKGIYTDKLLSGGFGCTRAEAMLYLWRYKGSPKGYTSSYEDVSTKYMEAVGWAVKNKVTTPKSAQEFDSMSRCTYEQIITYIYNVLK